MASTAEREILEREAELTEATQRVDVEALDRLYADDIIFTGVTGAICDKSVIMDEARRGEAERRKAAETKHFVASYEKDDLKVVARGDAAVTNYRFVVTIERDGQRMTHPYRTTNVWMKRQLVWQVVAGHTSVIAG